MTAMAKEDMLYFDPELYLEKTEIHRVIPTKNNGYSNSVITKNIGNHIEEDSAIIICSSDDESDEETHHKSNSNESDEEVHQKTNNIGGEIQLEVLREVEFNLNEVDHANDHKYNNEFGKRRRPGRPRLDPKRIKSDPISDDEYDEETKPSSSKEFSLKLGFLGKAKKIKRKIKKEKSRHNSTEERPHKRKCGRPLKLLNGQQEIKIVAVTDNIKSETISQDSDFSKSNIGIAVGKDGLIIEVDDTSDENEQSGKADATDKLDDKKIGAKEEFVNNVKEEVTSSVKEELVPLKTETIINVQPISVEPRRRMGRPPGPPKPPKTKGKRGRKPDPNKPPKPPKIPGRRRGRAPGPPKPPKIPGKRGRPRIYPEKPPKVPGRIGRPFGPPKPPKIKGPRGRPRLLGRPSGVSRLDFQRSLEKKVELDENGEIICRPKKKRGRPKGWSPKGRTTKPLGRPSKKKKKRYTKNGLNSGGGKSDAYDDTEVVNEPYDILSNGENDDIEIQNNYVEENNDTDQDNDLNDNDDDSINEDDISNISLNENNEIESESENEQNDGAYSSSDESDDISVTDRNVETIIEPSSVENLSQPLYLEEDENLFI